MTVWQTALEDVGFLGVDRGKGGKFVILRAGYKGELPAAYAPLRADTYSGYALLRVNMKSHGDADVAAAVKYGKRMKFYLLSTAANPPATVFTDVKDVDHDSTIRYDLSFFQSLDRVVQSEPWIERDRAMIDPLRTIGIEKGTPFAPDARMTRILEQAAKIGSAQMRVESFADRRADRVVWKDRQWEWAALRFENRSVDTPDYRDKYALDKWFFQAIATSPAMFRRDPGAGSLYWLGLRDRSGAYLDGGKTYKLTVPQPVPVKLFWSVTVYDAETRSQIQTDQGKAALRSLFELKDVSGSSVDLYFGPSAPSGHEGRWCRARGGSSTSASMGLTRWPSTGSGNRGISKKRSDRSSSATQRQ